MTSTTRKGWPRLLILAAGFGLASSSAPARRRRRREEAGRRGGGNAAVDINDVDRRTDLEARLEPAQCRRLDVDVPPAKGADRAESRRGNDISWSSNAKANGASAVSVKQSLTPFWDTRIGADMTVVGPRTRPARTCCGRNFADGGAPSQSSGTAWAAATAPGVGSIWDKTSIEARVDPGQEQGKLGTSLTKSLPLSEQYSLTLQNGYNVIQQGIVPVPGIVSHPSRNYETDQSARLSITDTGTSFVAGQTLSSTDDKWLRKFGAEQKLFDGVTISGSVGETAAGTTNKSISAGFKKSW